MSSRIIIAIGFACALSGQTPTHVDRERQLWTDVKRQLTGLDGDEYFQSSMKDAMLPRLKGTLISALPTENGNALVIGLTDSTTPEVAVLLRDLPSELGPGAQVEFEGVPNRFTRDPFLVTFAVEEATKPVPLIAPSWFFGPVLGVVRSGRYRNRSTRVEFDLPSDWTVEGTHPSFDNGDVAILKYSPFEGAVAGVWMTRVKVDTAEISKKLLAAFPEISAEGTKMSESLAWINTGRTQAAFFARTTAYDLPIFQTHFDQIISSAVVP